MAVKRELLVVVLIIGILAAIAIPSFLNQRGKAHDASAKAHTRAPPTAAETMYTNDQTYTNVSPANLKTIETALNNANITAASGTSNTFTRSEERRVGKAFKTSRATDGTKTQTCTRTKPDAWQSSGSCSSSF